MLSCFPNCVPSFFRQNSIQLSSNNSSLQKSVKLTTYSSVSKFNTEKDVLKWHNKKLKCFELHFEKSKAVSNFYNSISEGLCTKEFGEKLINQIFNASIFISDNVKLSLMCIKNIKANSEIKRGLQLFTRDLMFKDSKKNSRELLDLMETYYEFLDFNNSTVEPNEINCIADQAFNFFSKNCADRNLEKAKMKFLEKMVVESLNIFA